jgi:DNA-binding XRE family transcriptional regulator
MPKYFLSRLETLRNELHITKAAFAELCGVSRQSISAMIKNGNMPSIALAINIARNVKNISLKWLILGEGEMFIEPGPEQPASIPFTTAENLGDMPASEAVMTYYAVNTVVELSKQVEAYEVINDKLRYENRQLKDELKKLKP